MEKRRNQKINLQAMKDWGFDNIDFDVCFDDTNSKSIPKTILELSPEKIKQLIENHCQTNQIAKNLQQLDQTGFFGQKNLIAKHKIKVQQASLDDQIRQVCIQLTKL